MASTTITPDRDVVVSEIEIAAPPERVFQALIDRKQALQWGTNDAFEITLWEMDARPGGKWRFVSRERKGTGAGQSKDKDQDKSKDQDKDKDFDHHGEILEIDLRAFSPIHGSPIGTSSRRIAQRFAGSWRLPRREPG